MDTHRNLSIVSKVFIEYASHKESEEKMKQKKQKEMMKNARSNFDQMNQQGIFSPPL